MLNEKLKSLIKVGGDKDWNIYYVDQHGEKWVKSFPNGAYHAGSAPPLTSVENFPGIMDNES